MATVKHSPKPSTGARLTPTVSIVLPIYNEAGTFPSLVREITVIFQEMGWDFDLVNSSANKIVSKSLSFDDMDWSHTASYSIRYVGQIYVNIKGRDPEGIVEPSEAYERSSSARSAWTKRMSTHNFPPKRRPRSKTASVSWAGLPGIAIP